MGIFGKRAAPGELGGGLGRGVDAADAAETELPEIPASEAVIDAEPSRPVDTDPAFRSEVDEVMRETTPERSSWRNRLGRKGGRGGKAKGGDATLLADDGGDAGADDGVRAGGPAASAKGRFPAISLRRKGRSDARVAEESAATDKRLSNMVMIDFYPGLTKEDAIETARHWAMTHMDVPSLCFYFVMKIRDGFAVEVQEGVGKAYLPSVIELATENPGRIIVVPMVRRKLTVFYSARLGEFEAQILPELQEPPAMPENPPIQASRSTAMTPVLKQHMEWLYTGAATAAIGGLALLSSLIFYATDPRSKVPPEWHTTDVAQLPVMQWSRLNANATDSYVVRFEYQDGQWRIVRQSVNGATVDMSPAVGAATPPVDGGAAPDAGQPGFPAPAGDQGQTGQPTDAGQAGDGGQGAPTNIPPPSDAGGR